MKNRGITIENLAFETRLSAATISNILRLRFTPRERTLKAITDFFGIDIDEFRTSSVNPVNASEAMFSDENFVEDQHNLFIANLKFVKAKLNISDSDLADAASIPVGTVRNVIQHKTSPTMTVMEKISRGLKCPLYKLFDPGFIDEVKTRSQERSLGQSSHPRISL